MAELANFSEEMMNNFTFTDAKKQTKEISYPAMWHIISLLQKNAKEGINVFSPHNENLNPTYFKQQMKKMGYEQIGNLIGDWTVSDNVNHMGKTVEFMNKMGALGYGMLAKAIIGN